jgi:hypothetical protein
MEHWWKIPGHNYDEARGALYWKMNCRLGIHLLDVTWTTIYIEKGER